MSSSYWSKIDFLWNFGIWSKYVSFSSSLKRPLDLVGKDNWCLEVEHVDLEEEDDLKEGELCTYRQLQRESSDDVIFSSTIFSNLAYVCHALSETSVRKV